MAHICEKFTTTVIHKYALLICNPQNEIINSVNRHNKRSPAKDLELSIAVAAKVARDHRNEGCRQPDRDVLKNANLAGKQGISELDGWTYSNISPRSVAKMLVPCAMDPSGIVAGGAALGAWHEGYPQGLPFHPGRPLSKIRHNYWCTGYRQPRVSLTQVLEEGIQGKRLIALPDCAQAHLFATKNHAANGLNAVDGHHEQNPVYKSSGGASSENAPLLVLITLPDLTV